MFYVVLLLILVQAASIPLMFFTNYGLLFGLVFLLSSIAIDIIFLIREYW